MKTPQPPLLWASSWILYCIILWCMVDIMHNTYIYNESTNHVKYIMKLWYAHHRLFIIELRSILFAHYIIYIILLCRIRCIRLNYTWFRITFPTRTITAVCTWMICIYIMLSIYTYFNIMHMNMTWCLFSAKTFALYTDTPARRLI